MEGLLLGLTRTANIERRHRTSDIEQRHDSITAPTSDLHADAARVSIW
ncbi:hypothetical protein [Streptomyces sp. NBC_00503]|nr:hypothetical protein [Streptomyces sp. NBC_00503]WUD85618.1 hypothetical protein OG490_36510 [Streptomyces sp. NBC_00503]